MSETKQRYQPLYRWRRTQIDENDPPDDDDWSGYDGEVCIGRIQKQLHGPMKGKWMWTGGRIPHAPKRLLPHIGYIEGGREAMRIVEEWYHRQLALNGARGSMQP